MFFHQQILKDYLQHISFQPYITGIQLYNKRNPAPYDEPVIIAKLPKPIRKSDKISMIIKIRLDR